MGRKRVYETAADRQAAYRHRKECETRTDEFCRRVEVLLRDFGSLRRLDDRLCVAVAADRLHELGVAVIDAAGVHQVLSGQAKL